MCSAPLWLRLPPWPAASSLPARLPCAVASLPSAAAPPGRGRALSPPLLRSPRGSLPASPVLVSAVSALGLLASVVVVLVSVRAWLLFALVSLFVFLVSARARACVCVCARLPPLRARPRCRRPPRRRLRFRLRSCLPLSLSALRLLCAACLLAPLLLLLLLLRACGLSSFFSSCFSPSLFGFAFSCCSAPFCLLP